MIRDSRHGWRPPSRRELTATAPIMSDAILRVESTRLRRSDDDTAAAIAAALLLRRLKGRGTA